MDANNIKKGVSESFFTLKIISHENIILSLIIAEVSKKGIVLVKPKIYLQNLRKCRDFNLGFVQFYNKFIF
jgi:hypothetical protein